MDVLSVPWLVCFVVVGVVVRAVLAMTTLCWLVGATLAEAGMIALGFVRSRSGTQEIPTATAVKDRDARERDARTAVITEDESFPDDRRAGVCLREQRHVQPQGRRADEAPLRGRRSRQGSRACPGGPNRGRPEELRRGAEQVSRHAVRARQGERRASRAAEAARRWNPARLDDEAATREAGAECRWSDQGAWPAHQGDGRYGHPARGAAQTGGRGGGASGDVPEPRCKAAFDDRFRGSSRSSFGRDG